MACMCNLMRKCVTAVWPLLQWLRYFSTVCAQCSIGICSARAVTLLRAWRELSWGVLWDAHLNEWYYVTTTVCVLAPAKRCERCVFASAAAAAAAAAAAVAAAAAAGTITAVVVVCVHRHVLNQYCYYFHRLHYYCCYCYTTDAATATITRPVAQIQCVRAGRRVTAPLQPCHCWQFHC
jgi:hypothetical protein